MTIYRHCHCGGEAIPGAQRGVWTFNHAADCDDPKMPSPDFVEWLTGIHDNYQRALLATGFEPDYRPPLRQ